MEHHPYDAEAPLHRHRDYPVLEGEQRIGRIRFATERTPGVWLWNVTIHLTGGLPMGSARTSTRPRRSSRWPGQT